MTWGIPTDTFLQIHIIVSLVGILSGFLVLYGLLTGRPFGGWTALFLATTVLTSVTGFALPPFGFDPARAVGVISLVLLAKLSLRFMPSVSPEPGAGCTSVARLRRFT